MNAPEMNHDHFSDHLAPGTILTPCPFCGSANLVGGSWYVNDEEVDAIECEDCKAGDPAEIARQAVEGDE